MRNFTHLHVHTEYSLLDGAARIKDLIQRTKELGMPGIAITDHGVMYGVIDFYKEAKNNGVKPILGCEVYTAKRSRFDMEANRDSEQGHLVLLAENNTGYRNLMKIVSTGFTEGFYYKPRIDAEVLKKHSEGLIGLSACLSGDIPMALIEGDYSKARSLALMYEGIFGKNNFFLELQQNNIPDQNLANQGLIRLSKDTGIPLVVTNDVHYLKQEDARAHDILLCIQTAKKVNDEDRMKFNTDELYLKSAEEMWESFKEIPEALENTIKISERCNVELEFGRLHLPGYRLREGEDHFEFLKSLCYKGLEKRCGKDSKDNMGNKGIKDNKDNKDNIDNKDNKGNPDGKDLDMERIERLEYELSVIKQMGYVDFFLIVWDFIKYAKDKGIMVGPGRGSGASSLAAYCLGITNIDPLKYNLPFERFLNPERISMPDFDIDFCYERRQEVIDYVVDKYGEDRVAKIITFGTMAARAVVRDVGRALDISYAEVDTIAKMIPFQLGMTIDKALELNSELREAYNNDKRIKELIDTSRLFEGMPRHASTHAAGVLISKEPIVEYVPLQKNEDSITTQFPMTTLEELGLLKIDFLGLRTLTVLRDAASLIEKNYGIKIDYDNMEMDDSEVYKMIGEGKTTGVFQLESTGMTQFMKDLKPSCLEDIIAGIALYRPGPMERIPLYLKNKHNKESIKYAHPMLEDILDVTYGCIVYQEQVLQIVRRLAGYSMGRADLVRRAMAKKKPEVMKEERQKFIYGFASEDGNIIIKGALRNGIDEETANKIFDEMMDFAGYGFNKPHSASYAVIAYQTAWLKHYYPVEFMAASMNSYLGSTDKISRYVNECKLTGIEVLPPDINESNVGFDTVKGKIRFGMAAVKNVGINAIKQIIMEREQGGIFKTFRDFCERVSGREINRKCIESLIKCGAFDSLGISRSKLMASYENMIDSIQEGKRKKMDGQVSFFDIPANKEKDGSDEDIYPDVPEYPPNVLFAMEKEMLGLYVSGHPLDELREEILSNVTLSSVDLSAWNADSGEELLTSEDKNRILSDGMHVTVGGIISGVKIKATKNDNLMAFITIEDLYGPVEIIVFPQELNRYRELLVPESIVLIKGRLSIREDEEPKVICSEVKPITSTVSEKKHDIYDTKTSTGNEPLIAKDNRAFSQQEAKPQKLYIRLNGDIAGDENSEWMKSFFSLLEFFRGNTPVYLYYPEEKKARMAERKYWVTPAPVLIAELEERFGKDNVKLV